jgi:hypothetical protein
VPAAHEVLVDLVRGRVGDPEREGQWLAADGAHQQ